MNQKELSELRRRFHVNKNNIAKIYGCYVNTRKEIISYLDEPLDFLHEDEAEKFLSLLRKTLSGTLGRNLMDIVFSTEQVMDSEEHRLLNTLRQTGLQDKTVRDAFYQKAIESIDMDEQNYLLLLIHDTYDVPGRGKDDEFLADASDTVFSYLVCCVCPVKDGKTELGYFPEEQEFHHCMSKQIVGQPELGFLFPAFDDRAANIYNALFYTRKPELTHQTFIDSIFHVEELPLSAPEQKLAFEAALSESLDALCTLETVQSIHEQICEKIELHKERKDPEPLALTAREIGTVLTNCGIPEEQVRLFEEKCGEHLGEAAALSPANLIDSKRFEVRTGEATIHIDPKNSYLIETRVIDGRSYLLIPADDSTTVNGLPVNLSHPTTEE